MNLTVIGLGIIILILLYMLYNYYGTITTKLIANASLTVNNPPITAISNATSRRYAYGIWVYVNSWDNTNQKVIFRRENNIRLYLDRSSPTLYCDIRMTDGSTITTTITDNFTIQRWVYVIVSLDNQFLDCYLDGKLVKSTRLYGTATATTAIPITPPSDTVPISLGNAGGVPFDAVVSKFVRWTKPMDPQTAWSTYLSSNTSNLLGSFNSYGIDLNIFQNNAKYANLKLF